jgi:DNA-directed RNA polymerase subunit beta'
MKATVIVRDGDKVKAGEILVKIPRDVGKTRDITGGLPRIAELFEARNPSNPAVVTEVDGIVKYGKIKRGVREIHILGKEKENTYKIPYGKHILVHEGDYVFAGDRLCEGAVSPKDILRIRGASKVQEYLVDAIQEVYRLQGVSINDKHIEVIVRQMMQKVTIEDSGDSLLLQGDRVNRFDVLATNEALKKKVVIANPGDSDYEEGDVVESSNVKDVNKDLKASKKTLIKTTKASPVTFSPLLLGITRASLNTESFISAASFQETTRVLTDAAVEGKTDYLKGLKENVIIGRIIPAGTGAYRNRDLLVANPTVVKEAEKQAHSKEVELESIAD